MIWAKRLCITRHYEGRSGEPMLDEVGKQFAVSPGWNPDCLFSRGSFVSSNRHVVMELPVRPSGLPRAAE